MSKPDKPGELRDVDVVAVSLVSRAANKHKFAIYKSAKEEERVREPTKEGFFEMCRKFFIGERGEDAEKGVVKDAEIAAEVADGDDALKAEASAELEKAGKKICGARMKKLMDIRAALDAIIAEGDETDNAEKGETNDMTRDELSEMLKGELAPITERLEKLEAREEEAEKNAEPQAETLTAEDVAKAVAEAVQPLAGRIEALEKARGMSNRLPDEGEETKKAAGFWSGAILG